MIGLTGTPEACSVAARAFRVYHHKTNETKDYLVDHSIITYLLGTPLRAGQCALSTVAASLVVAIPDGSD